MRKNKFSNFVRKIHLWLGLSTGLIVFLVSISGAIYAFRDEIFDYTYSDYIYLRQVPSTNQKEIQELWNIAENSIPDSIKINHLYTYSESNKAWMFRAYADQENAWNYFDQVIYDIMIYVDPYTGEVLGAIDHKNEFFQVIKMFHWNFLLNDSIGQTIIGSSILIFVFSLITGLYMWFKSKNSIKKKLSVNFKSKWRRTNYDLHNVLGIYGSIFGFLFAFIGLIWAFQWFMALVYVIVNISITPPDNHEYNSANIPFQQETLMISKVKKQVDKEYPNAYGVIYNLPHHSDQKEEPLEVIVKNQSHIYYDGAIDQFDWKTGKKIHSLKFKNLSRGEKLIYMNYDIHVGAILGLTGKIIAFIASLLVSALPITGFLIWWGRKKKSKTRRTKNEISAPVS